MGVVNYKFNGINSIDVDNLSGKERVGTSVKKSGRNICTGFQVRIDTALISGGGLTWSSPFGFSVDSTFDWGDGTITRETSSPATHTYGSSGQYDVRVYSNTYNYPVGGSKEPIIGIEDWTEERVSNMSSHGNLVTFPSTTQPTWIAQQFLGSNPLLNGTVDHWNPNGNTMRLFKICPSFNQPINSWDVSALTSFLETFRSCSDFNQPLSNWDIGSGIDFGAFLLSSTSFNQDLGAWRFNETQKSTGTTNGTATNKLVDTTADFISDGVVNSDYAKNITTGEVIQITGRTATELTFASDAFSSGQSYRVFTGINMTQFLSNASAFNNGGVSNPGLDNWTTKNIVGFGASFQNTDSNFQCGAWDTSACRTLGSIFIGCATFNQDIGNWNTEAVVGMGSMLSNCTAFNNGGVVGVGVGMDTWDTSRVTDMKNAFTRCGINSYLGSWDVSSVIDMEHMFKQAPNVTGLGFGNWNTESCMDYDEMFFGCPNINFPITHPNFWTIAPGANVNNPFQGTAFNGGQASGVSGRNAEFKFSTDPADEINIKSLFVGIGAEFNQDVSTDSVNGYWEMDRVVGMSSLFGGATNFNQDLSNWNVGACTNFSNLFSSCSSFNNLGVGGTGVGLDTWNVSSALNMAGMFLNCASFDQYIGSWNVSGVTSMESMFQNANNFDQDISGWNTSSVTTMRRMFFNRTPAFSYSVASWNIASLQNASEFINVSSAFSTSQYDAILDNTTGWASQATIQSGVSLGMAAVNYTLGGNAEAGRNVLTGTYGWTIVDGGGV